MTTTVQNQIRRTAVPDQLNSLVGRMAAEYGVDKAKLYPELPPRCRDYAVGAFRTYSLAHFTPRSLYICRCSFTGSPGMTTFSKTFAF